MTPTPKEKKKQNGYVQLNAFGCVRTMRVPLSQMTHPREYIYLPHLKPVLPLDCTSESSGLTTETLYWMAVFVWRGTTNLKGYPIYYFSHLK